MQSERGSEVPSDGLEETNDRNIGFLCHVSAIIGLTIIPGVSIAGPLIIWLLKKDSDPVADREGKEAINFNLSFTIYMIIAFVAGFVLYPVVFLVWLVLVIIASSKIRTGTPYRYPLTIRFLK